MRALLQRHPALLSTFFAVSACSWMPHWSCHYYRLETGSTFIVGSYSFSSTASLVSMAIYTMLIGANLVAVSLPMVRPAVAMTSGTLHFLFAVLHGYRLCRPFRFEVLGYPWSRTASLREVVIVGAFGVVSTMIGILLIERLWSTKRIA